MLTISRLRGDEDPIGGRMFDGRPLREYRRRELRLLCREHGVDVAHDAPAEVMRHVFARFLDAETMRVTDDASH